MEIKKQYLLGWTRDSKGIIKYRPVVKVANCLTTFCGKSVTGKDGMGNTQNYVLEICEY